MTVTVALVATVVVLVGVNVWVHAGPARWQPVTGPLVAVALLLRGPVGGPVVGAARPGRGSVVAGSVGAGAAVALVACVYAVGLAVPAWRRALPRRAAPGRARLAPPEGAAVVPLGVVVLEEVAFRGVLWGLVDLEHGARGPRDHLGALRAVARAAGGPTGLVPTRPGSTVRPGTTVMMVTTVVAVRTHHDRLGARYPRQAGCSAWSCSSPTVAGVVFGRACASRAAACSALFLSALGDERARHLLAGGVGVSSRQAH